MTLGEKISHMAKAIAALCVALVSLFTAILATLPAEVPEKIKSYAVWIQSALAFLTVASVWLTANGPKIGNAVDTIDQLEDVVGGVLGRGKHREQ